LEIFDRALLDRSPDVNPGTVDKDVDPAETAHGFAECVLDTAGAGRRLYFGHRLISSAFSIALTV
jgi:hypothetical protein